jgi:hypothetical protein
MMLGGVGFAAAAALAAAPPPISFAPFVTVPHCTLGEADTCLDASRDIAAGDFDHDGNADVAIADSESNDVTLLFGDGKGGLSVKGTLPAAIEPSAIAAGKLNADEFTDLVVAKDMSNAISVFLSNGDGTFRSAVDYAMGMGPQGVVLADFDGNGTLDVATADYIGDTISVRLGKGDGTFGDLKQTPIEGGPWGLAAGALDAEGGLDLVVTLVDPPCPGPDRCHGAVAPLLGKGDGTFTYGGSAANAAVEDGPVRIALADFNHDGNLDAAVVAEEAEDFGLDVLLGKGDGTFQPQVSYVIGAFPEDVVAADLNGDGIIDLATADSFGTAKFDNVSILLGIGDGTFVSAQPVAIDTTDAEPYGLVAVDLDGDRHLDIVTANYGATLDRASILRNTTFPACVGDCDGNGIVSISDLITGVAIALGSTPVGACRMLDSNGDGMVEIAELVAAVNNALNGCPNA